jgi:hypothetical protein
MPDIQLVRAISLLICELMIRSHLATIRLPTTRGLIAGPLNPARFGDSGRIRRSIAARGLIQFVESVWRQLGVPNRVLDVLVTKETLDEPGIVAAIGQVVAASMP